MVIYLNEKGEVRSIPSSIPQGTVLRSVVIIGPKSTKTLVLKVLPPSQEVIPDIICQTTLDADKNIVYSATIPEKATKYAGKAEYQFDIIGSDGHGDVSERGSFIITVGVPTDMPDTVEELEKHTIGELYDLLRNVNIVYDLFLETNSDVNELKDLVGALTIAINKKVEKLTPNDNLPWLYVANPDGSQGHSALTSAMIANSVMFRDKDGQSKVDIPRDPQHIANKLFVEAAISVSKNDLLENIKEVEIIAKGATKAISFNSYSNLVMDLNQADATKYSVGQPFLIGTVDVPDLWVFAVYPTPFSYDYVDDASMVKTLESKNFISIGYYALAPLETQKVVLTDYAKTEYVDNELAKKISIPEASKDTQIPVVESDGKTSSRALTPQPLPETIMYRDSNGICEVKTPQKSSDIANKGYVDSNFSNALKGTESGATVSMDDVSPIPHKIPVKTSSKNLFDISKVTNTSAITNNGDGSLTVTVYYSSTHKEFRELCPHVKVGDTVIMSANTTGANFVYFSITGETIYYKTPFVVTQDRFDSDIAFYGKDTNSADKTAIVKDIQVELGTVATPFVPYVADDTEITVKSYGKNLFDIYTIAQELVSNRPDGFAIVEFDGRTCLKCVSSVNAYYYSMQGLNAHGFRCRMYTKGYTASIMGLQYSNGTNGYIGTSDINKWVDFSRYYSDRVIDVISFYVNAEEGNEAYLDLDSVFVEASAIETEYEPYKEGETITTTIAEGAELNSIAPNMTIATDTQGVVINTEYNKDTNKVIEKLTQSIISLGGNI